MPLRSHFLFQKGTADGRFSLWLDSSLPRGYYFGDARITNSRHYLSTYARSINVVRANGTRHDARYQAKAADPPSAAIQETFGSSGIAMLSKLQIGQKAERTETKGLPEIWATWRNAPFMAVIFRYLVALDDWISDPPTTERERINHYIKETRTRWHKRYLAGR